MARYVSATEAAERLGVARATLYAYVSRGFLKAREDGDPRRSLYLAEDVERLAKERKRGRRPGAIARSTLDWGVPALEFGADADPRWPALLSGPRRGCAFGGATSGSRRGLAMGRGGGLSTDRA